MAQSTHRNRQDTQGAFARRTSTSRSAFAERAVALGVTGSLVILLLGIAGNLGAPAVAEAAGADDSRAAGLFLSATGNSGAVRAEAANPPRTVVTHTAANARRTPPRAILRGFGQGNGADEAPAPNHKAEGMESAGSAGSGNGAAVTGSGPSSAASTPGTLAIGGTVIPYRDVRGGTTPATGAGLWLGSDAVDDGSWGYFIGHNPGSFAPVRSLKIGDAVTLTDQSGKRRTYRVRSVLTVSAAATWKTVAPLVAGFGESVILQTCTGNGLTNTIVVAA